MLFSHVPVSDCIAMNSPILPVSFFYENFCGLKSLSCTSAYPSVYALVHVHKRFPIGKTLHSTLQ